MSPHRFHPSSFLAGAGLILLASFSLGPKAPSKPEVWEYQIVEDPEAKQIAELADADWEYAGYLGLGVKGSNNDQTLWKRPAK